MWRWTSFVVCLLGVASTPLAASQAEGRPELPAALRQSVLADAAQRSGVPEKSLRIKSVEAVTWPDGSLGCPQPGAVYTQALVPGYRIVIEANGTEYPYHAAEQGRFELCRNPGGVWEGYPER